MEKNNCLKKYAFLNDKKYMKNVFIKVVKILYKYLKSNDHIYKQKVGNNMSKTIAYIRVSSKGQNLDRQIEDMKKLGIEEKNIYSDKQSRKRF